MIRVAHVKSNYGHVGGIESMLEGLMPHLAQQPGVEPVVYFLSHVRDPALEARLSAGGMVRLRHVPWSGLKAAPLAARRMAQALAEDGIDIVHSHDMRANLMAAMTRYRSRRWICHIHGWLGATHSPLYRLFETLDRALMRRADLVLTGSEATLAEVRAAGARRTAVLPNAVPLPDLAATDRAAARAALGLPTEPTIFTVMGRLHHGKGQDLFLRALAALPPNAAPWLGLIVGSGGEAEALGTLAAELGVADRVRLTGFVSETGPYVAASDVIAVPSRKESLPLTCLEGMAAGRAVVAARAGDLPQVIADGETGLLVAIDDVDELAQAFTRLLGDPAFRGAMGERARHFIAGAHTVPVLAARMAEAARNEAARR